MRSIGGFVALVLAVVAIVVVMPARAQQGGPELISVAVAGGPLGMSLRPEAGALQPVQSRSCRSCRRDCYYDFRLNCGYSDRCRRLFTSCMRDCWEQVCR